MMKKNRIDKILLNLGLAESRSAAQKMILEGAVSVKERGEWRAVIKASEKFETLCEFKVKPIDELRYASRAGLKLAAALAWLSANEHGLKLEGMSALDIGQSSGGFTDCLLEQGVNRIVGVEVGHGQLIERLRRDDRVVCLEGVNARSLDKSTVLAHAPEGFDLCVMDVSFISQTKILPQIPPCLKARAYLLTLIKPQFEVGRTWVDKGGIVASEAARAKAIHLVTDCARALGFNLLKILPSPVPGGDGNLEYLLIAKR